MRIHPKPSPELNQLLLWASTALIWCFCLCFAGLVFALQWGTARVQLLDGDFHVPLLIMSYLLGGFLGFLAASWFYASSLSLTLKELLALDGVLLLGAYFSLRISHSMGHSLLSGFFF